MDLDVLVDDEITRCRSVISRYGPDSCGPLNQDRQLGAFVRECLDAHLPLVKLWGGWRTHLDVSLDTPPSSDEVRDAWRSAGGDFTPYFPSPNFMNVFQQKASPTEVVDQRLLRSRDDVHEPLVVNLAEYCRAGAMNDSRIVESLERTLKEVTAGVKVWTADSALAPIFLSVSKGQTTIRAVRQQLKKRYGCSDFLLGVIDKFSSNMGQLWANGNSVEWGLTLSCAPSSFLRLGHYGEGNSCYRFGHEFDFSKFYLALSERTYVGLLYKPPCAIPHRGDSHVVGGPRVGEVQGRFFGRLHDPGTPNSDIGIIYSNVYMVERITVERVLTKYAEHLHAERGDESRPYMFTEVYGSTIRADASSGDIYLNGDGRLMHPDTHSFTTLSNLLGRSTTNLDLARLLGCRIECYACSASIHEDNTTTCENCRDTFCPECASYCEGCHCTYCNQCSGSSYCASCDSYYCVENCTATCEGCSDTVCTSCIGSCGQCGDPFCDRCLDQTCEQCDEHMCEACTTAAECENCGSMCENCEGSGHECETTTTEVTV